MISNSTSNLPETGFIRLPTVQKITGTAVSTIWLWVKKGLFPKPHKIGPNTTAWKIEEVRQWIEDKSKREETHHA